MRFFSGRTSLYLYFQGFPAFAQPIANRMELPDAQIQTESVKGLFRRNGIPGCFQPEEGCIDIGGLVFDHVLDPIRVKSLGKIQAGDELQPDGTHTATGGRLEPIFKATATFGRYFQELTGGKLFLLKGTGGDIALIYQSLQDGIGLTLADVPDMSEFGDELFLQYVAMIGLIVKKSKQGVFWRTGAAMMMFYRHIYTHSVSISENSQLRNLVLYIKAPGWLCEDPYLANS